MLNPRGDIQLLHPAVQPVFSKLLTTLHDGYATGKTKTWFQIFETYRSPSKQAELFAQGRTTAGPRVTKAEPFRSPHQYGLAADFVPQIQRQHEGQAAVSWAWDWSGEHDWAFLHSCARSLGLHPIGDWDKPHIEHNLWLDWKTIVGWVERRDIDSPF